MHCIFLSSFPAYPPWLHDRVMTEQSNNLRSRLQHGISWNIVSAISTQGSVFLANVFVANLLGKAVFGEFGMIQSTILTISGIAQVATGITATKYVAEFRSVDKERAGRILGLCSAFTSVTAGIACLLLLVGAPWLATATLKAPQLSGGLMIASGFVLFAVINGYQTGALAGLEAYRSMARVGVIQGVAHLAVCTLAAWCWGLEGGVGGLTCSAFIRWYLNKRALTIESRRHSIEILYANIWLERKILFGFALPAAISGLTTMPALWLANSFLVRQPDGFAQMGLYSAASTFRIIVMFLPVLLNSVGTSLLNNQRGLGNEMRFRKVFWANFTMTLGAVFVGSLFIAFAGRWLLQAFGKDFGEGYTVLLILLLSTIIEAAALTFYQIIQSKEKMWLSFFAVALPRDSLLVVLAYYLIPCYGATGLASAYAISWVLALLTILICVYFLKINTTNSHMQVGVVN